MFVTWVGIDAKNEHFVEEGAAIRVRTVLQDQQATDGMWMR